MGGLSMALAACRVARRLVPAAGPTAVVGCCSITKASTLWQARRNPPRDVQHSAASTQHFGPRIGQAFRCSQHNAWRRRRRRRFCDAAELGLELASATHSAGSL